jgi:hypothetical protein
VINTIRLGHSFEAPGATAPDKTEQHSLGLIILSVGEQYPSRPAFFEGFTKGRITRLSRRVLGAFTTAHLHNLREDRGESPPPSSAGGSGNHLGRIRLKLMINNDSPDPHAKFWQFCRCRPGKSQ